MVNNCLNPLELGISSIFVMPYIVLRPVSSLGFKVWTNLGQVPRKLVLLDLFVPNGVDINLNDYFPLNFDEMM